jgi:hypothetical protein
VRPVPWCGAPGPWSWRPARPRRRRPRRLVQTDLPRPGPRQYGQREGLTARLRDIAGDMVGGCSNLGRLYRPICPGCVRHRPMPALHSTAWKAVARCRQLHGMAAQRPERPPPPGHTGPSAKASATTARPMAWPSGSMMLWTTSSAAAATATAPSARPASTRVRASLASVESRRGESVMLWAACSAAAATAIARSGRPASTRVRARSLIEVIGNSA